MYPQAEVPITSLTIHPGDSISANVSFNAGQFTLHLVDNVTGQSYTTVQTGAGAQRSSAEWIVEAPTVNGTIGPLANFGSATFSAASATLNGVTGPINDAAWQNVAINMYTPQGATATTSEPAVSSFTVTYDPPPSPPGGSAVNSVCVSSPAQASSALSVDLGNGGGTASPAGSWMGDPLGASGSAGNPLRPLPVDQVAPSDSVFSAIGSRSQGGLTGQGNPFDGVPMTPMQCWRAHPPRAVTGPR
jgi:hypothetical protein